MQSQHIIEQQKWTTKSLKEHIVVLNKLGKSLGATANQLQVPQSTVQTVVSIGYMA